MFWEKIVDTGVRGVVHEGAAEAIARDGLRALADPARGLAPGDPLADAVSRLLG